MAEFDDKLQALLSNPDAMSQIMQMAQSLTGGTSTSPASAPPAPPPGSMPMGMGTMGGGAMGGSTAAAPPEMQSASTPPSPKPGIGPDLLASLASGLAGGGSDSGLISRLLPLIQELGGSRDSNARTLLYALRPYLKAERQEKVERALQLARLFHLARKFLSGWEG